MTKASSTELENFDRFVRAMAEVMGISRRRLDKILFQGQTPPSLRRRPTPRSQQRSSLAVK